MSVKQVSCPHCRKTMNVMASMASVQCQSCGQIFAVSAAAAPADTSPTRQTSPPTTKRSAESGNNNLVPWAIFGGVFLLAVAGIAVMTFVLPGDSASDTETGDPVAQADPETGEVEIVQPAAEASENQGPPTYEIVDLPESTRKKIYREYNAMMDSSFGKAKRIPKSGVAGQSLRNMLGETVKRELTRMALIYGIEEDEILDVIAEGDDKGW